MWPLSFLFLQEPTPLLGYAEYGVLGLTILGLGMAVVKLYGDKQKLYDRIEALFRQNADTLDRLATAIRDMTAAQTSATQRMMDQLDIARRLEAIERHGEKDK